jgi:hypothetical protein
VAQKLDCVQFASMADEDVFGFIDPNNILRSSHIVPAFARGKIHTDTSIYLGSEMDDSEDDITSDESDNEERLQLNDMYDSW